MERIRNYDRSTNDETQRKMPQESEFGTHKTILVLTIVAGCFAVLWPNIFYPMLSTSVKSVPLPSDSSVGCCDLIFESDVNTVDILREMCMNILKHHQIDPRVRDALKINKLSQQSASFCRDEVLTRCGIDLSEFLAEKERLGKSYKQVFDEIRSFNSSLCLKTHFGVPLSQLGLPHLIRYHILMPHTPIKQERRLPPHAGGLHPAMRERGRAIPSSHIVPRVEGRPEHVVVQKMRPPMGAAGRVVAPQSATGSMGIIMPLYTMGILLFFLYTIAKVLRKNSNSEIYPEYVNPEAEREFRNRVFNPEILSSAITGVPYYRKERSSTPVRPAPTIEELKRQAAGDIEVDQLLQRLVDTEAAMERIVVQMGNLPRADAINPLPNTQGEFSEKYCCGLVKNSVDEVDDISPTVKIMGMEMTASAEGGQKISRPSTPIIPPHSPSQSEREKTPPKPIYLEGSLPPQCELLVTDSETQAENLQEDAESVVLSGKMTLSLISLDQIPGDSEDTNTDDYDEINQKVTVNDYPEEIEENFRKIENEKTENENKHLATEDQAKNDDEDADKEGEEEEEEEDEDEVKDDDVIDAKIESKLVKTDENNSEEEKNNEDEGDEDEEEDEGDEDEEEDEEEYDGEEDDDDENNADGEESGDSEDNSGEAVWSEQ